MTGRTIGGAAALAAAAWLAGAACAEHLPDQDRRILSAVAAAKLSADVLWAEYRADPAAAGARYRGRAIEVSGRATRSSGPSPGVVFFAQETGPAEAGVEARLLDDQAASILASLADSRRVTLKCFCEGLDGNLILKSCVRP